MPIPPPYMPQIQTPNIATVYLQGMMLKKEMEKAEAATAANELARLKLQNETEMMPYDQALKASQAAKAMQEVESGKRLNDIAGQLPAMMGQPAQSGYAPQSWIMAGSTLIQGAGDNPQALAWGKALVDVGKSMVTMDKEQQETVNMRLQSLAASLVSGHLQINSLNDNERQRLEQLGAVDSNKDGYYDIPTDPAVRSVLHSVGKVNDFVPSGYGLSPEYGTRGPLNQPSQPVQTGQMPQPLQSQQIPQQAAQGQQPVLGGQPRMEKFPGTQAPLSDREQQNMTQWVESWNLLQQMKSTVDQTGFVKGNLGLPQLAAKMGVNLPTTDAGKAQLFGSALNKFTLAGQAMIQGIPSNYDVQVMTRSMAEWGVAPELNLARIRLWERAIKDSVRYKIAFHKNSNMPIPPEIIDMAKRAGIDVNNPNFKPMDWREYADDLKAAGITTIYDKESGKVVDLSNYNKGEDPRASNPPVTIDFNTMTPEQKQKFMEYLK